MLIAALLPKAIFERMLGKMETKTQNLFSSNFTKESEHKCNATVFRFSLHKNNKSKFMVVSRQDVEKLRRQYGSVVDVLIGREQIFLYSFLCWNMSVTLWRTGRTNASVCSSSQQTLFKKHLIIWSRRYQRPSCRLHCLQHFIAY